MRTSILDFWLLLLAAEGLALPRTGIVQLFEWKFSEVAKECSQFLGPRGFYGVQVSPITENGIVADRPWYERYQPISYKIESRSGNEEDFKTMVKICHDAGVKVFVDVVFNHMTGDIPNAHGESGTTADTKKKFYPGVPYDSSNFHSTCQIDNYQDKINVRDCELVGLHDLDQSQEYVRGKIVEFLNTLLTLGVAGFRVDAAKHMWPKDLEAIYSKVKLLNSSFGYPKDSKPYIYQEVIDLGGEPIKASEYVRLGPVIDFKYSREIGRAFGGKNELKWLKTFGPSWDLLPSEDALVFVDNHDNQRDGGDDILSFKRPKQYKMANAFMLAWPHGERKRIMSSYEFSERDQGPPCNKDESIADVVRNPDESCGGGWVCEHRWRQIYQMVEFSNTVGDSQVTNFWDNGNNQIAFCRGNKGFVAFNGDSSDLNQTLQTCLPPGDYCDVISGTRLHKECSGKRVTVGNDGRANIFIGVNESDGVLAIHLGTKL